MNLLGKFLVVFWCITALSIVACQPAGPQTVPRPTEAQQATPPKQEIEVVKVVMYSENLYYFPQIRDEFAKNLVWFMKQHPDLEVVTMSPDVETSKNYATGYFVVFKKKPTITKEPVINEAN